MACYYLVISSTHLSNGHFRSIKGVFRGPLCRSAGGESPVRNPQPVLVSGRATVRATRMQFHIFSPSFSPRRQRLKELKQREFARNVASKSWKDERKQERALKRLYRLAELRQRSDCGGGRGQKLRTAAVTAKDEHPGRVSSERDCRPSTRPLCPVPNGASAGATRCPLGPPVHRDQPHGRKKQSQSSHSSRRLGISFCFSRKAQLKLESCASVFSDGAEETPGDRRALQRLRGKRCSDAFPCRAPSPANVGSKAAHGEDYGKESTATSGQNSPPAASPGSPERSDADSRLRDLGQKPAPEVECKDSRRSDRVSSRGPPVPDGRTETEAIPHPRAAIIAQEPLRSPGSAVTARSWENTKTDDAHKYVTEDCAPRQRCIVADGDLNKNQVSFVNVLSRDGDAMLKWPKELLCYTKSEPYVSYSCNPLYFTFSRSRNKQNTHGNTQKAGTPEPGHGDGEEDRDTGEGKSAAIHVRSQPEKKSGTSKPKRAKHHKVHETQCPKPTAVSKLSTACTQNAEGLARVEGPQVDTPQNKCSMKKRSGLGKRRRSFKDETSNPSKVAARSLRSLVCSLPASMSKKKKRHALLSEHQILEGRSFPGPARFSTRNHDFMCHRGTDRCSSTREKLRPRSFLSDLSSDSEGPPCPGRKHSLPCRSSRDPSPKSRGYIREHSTAARTRSGSSGSDGSYNTTRGFQKSIDAHMCHRMRFLWEGSAWDTDLEQSVRRNGRIGCKRRTNGGQSPSSWSSGSASDLSRDNWAVPHPLHVVRKRARSFDEPLASEDTRPSSGKPGSVSKDESGFAKLSSIQDAKRLNDVSGDPSDTKEQLVTPNVSAAKPSIDKPANDKNSVRKKVKSVLSLPLIGKFPAVRRRAKKGEASVVKGNSGQSQLESKEHPGPMSRPQHQLLAPGDASNSLAPQQRKLEARDTRTEGQLGSQSVLPQGPSSGCLVSSTYPTYQENCCQGHTPSEPAVTSGPCYMSLPEADKPLKCASPPLSEQPITFSPDEIDKYRQLQLQAQQHIQQQQLLGRQAKVLPETLGEIPDAGPMHAFHHAPLLPPTPVPAVPHVLLPHRTLAAFASSLAPHPPASLHPLAPSRFAAAPLPSMGPTLIPALLPGPPLHLVPASAFQPAHVALHPIPHGPLLPALLGPAPLSAAAASTLHLHQLLQPLFPGQNLHPHSGPTT
ncbi:zinc finger protein 804B [Arapaima gigas]